MKITESQLREIIREALEDLYRLEEDANTIDSPEEIMAKDRESFQDMGDEYTDDDNNTIEDPSVLMARDRASFQDMEDEYNDDDSYIGPYMEEAIEEKAKSKAQQRFMGMVHAVQKGELDADEVGSSVAKAAKSMKKSDVKDFAETKHKGLPNHVDESCDGNDPYCGEKHDIEKAEKNSPDKPIKFTKKQKPIKLAESQLRNVIREAIVEILSEQRNNRPFHEYASEYQEKHGEKLPDEQLKDVTKKKDDRFHDRNCRRDGKYNYIPKTKDYNWKMGRLN